MRPRTLEQAWAKRCSVSPKASMLALVHIELQAGGDAGMEGGSVTDSDAAGHHISQWTLRGKQANPKWRRGSPAHTSRQLHLVVAYAAMPNKQRWAARPTR